MQSFCNYRLSGAGALLALAFVLMSAVLTTTSAQAQTFTTIHKLSGSAAKGPSNGPLGLVQATNGDFYGTTLFSGASGDGTVFKVTPAGALTTLHTFDLTDGEYPYAQLVQASNGDLYGSMYAGGANNNAGTIYKITLGGTLTTIYNFCSQSSCTDGMGPYVALIQGTDGNLYGTTTEGGANIIPTTCPSGCGTVFRITPDGMLTTLHSFNGTDGALPSAALVQASDGNFYGTTELAGANGTGGTIFRITLGGTLTTLYNFCSQSSCTDGFAPNGALVQASNGDLYGTTILGGTNNNSTYCNSAALGCGTVFEISTGGAFTSLYSFCALTNCTDGANPQAGLTQATDGNLYGTAYQGGANGQGSAFQLTTGGTLTTLYSLCSTSTRTISCTDGANTFAGLLQGTNGLLYGTAFYGGGKDNSGTIFSISMGLGAFVETQTGSGAVGATVKILGSDLTGATSVTFNGTPATAFTVVSATEITTKVPAGATTGTVAVVTPGGTLISNVVYTVESKTATPTFSPKAGTYTGAQNVSINDVDSGAVIYYTTDGTTPTTSSTQYTGTAVSVASSETLKAIAIAPAYALSAVKTGAYAIN